MEVVGEWELDGFRDEEWGREEGILMEMFLDEVDMVDGLWEEMI